jgi:alkaline phosphatase D
VLARAIKDVSPELAAAETASRGWSELLLTPEAITNQWHFVSTVLDRDYTVARANKQVCKAGDKRFS